MNAVANPVRADRQKQAAQREQALAALRRAGHEGLSTWALCAAVGSNRAPGRVWELRQPEHGGYDIEVTRVRDSFRYTLHEPARPCYARAIPPVVIEPPVGRLF